MMITMTAVPNSAVHPRVVRHSGLSLSAALFALPAGDRRTRYVTRAPDAVPPLKAGTMGVSSVPLLSLLTAFLVCATLVCLLRLLF